MKKFIVMFAIAIIGFSLFAEVKSLMFENNGTISTLFYSDYKEEGGYWSKDEILESSADRPFIYFDDDDLDYIMGATWDTDFSEWTERLMEVVAPILKKYKYVEIYDETGCYFVEHFLIGKNKIFGRFWNINRKETK